MGKAMLLFWPEREGQQDAAAGSGAVQAEAQMPGITCPSCGETLRWSVATGWPERCPDCNCWIPRYRFWTRRQKRTILGCLAFFAGCAGPWMYIERAYLLPRIQPHPNISLEFVELLARAVTLLGCIASVVAIFAMLREPPPSSG